MEYHISKDDELKRYLAILKHITRALMGVYEALINGASSTQLLEKSKQIIPDNIMLHCCLEVAPYISPDVFRVGLFAIK